MKLPTTILLIFASTLAYSQDRATSRVFHKVLTEEISNEQAYIRCDKPKTYFNKSGFNDQNGLSVPMKVLQELEESAFKSSEGKWDPAVIQSITHYFLNSKDCLTRESVERLFKDTGTRQTVISISEPVFDKEYENCIVSVTINKFTGSAYGHSCFLSKVFGVWTIVTTFDVWMS